MSTPLYTTYKETVVPELKKELGYTNVMEVPKIDKVTLNVGYGRHHKDASFIEQIDATLQRITGLKPVHNTAKKSISNFKIREGVPVGASVTLRGAEMYTFLYKLIHLALPRVRDFRGINKKSFDKQGNYTLGLTDSTAFPEITGEAAEKSHGLEIVITTTAKNSKEGYILLDKLGFPFKK